MNITFNLKDAKMFIPHGRFMNLKGKLNLKKGELTDQDIKSIMKSALEQDYHIVYDIEEQVIRKANTILHNRYEKDNRERMYGNYVNTWFSKYQYSAKKIALKQEQLDLAFGYAKEKILADEKIQQKLKKLQQLRLVNNV